MRTCQGDPQITGNQQHDRPGDSGQLSEKFRMAGKRHAGVVNNAFLQGQSDHRRESFLQTAIYRVSQAIEQYIDVGDRRLSAYARLCECHGNHLQLTGDGWSRSCLVQSDFRDRDGGVDQLRARAQRFGVCNNDDLNRQRCP